MPSEKLAAHVEAHVFPVYAQCDPGHRLDHVRTVLRRAAAFAEGLPDIDQDVLFAAVAYHDVGCAVDRERHEKISAEALRHDPVARKLLGPDRLELAAEAIEDHRASSGREPRSAYGRILSSADRNVDLGSALLRAWQFRLSVLDEKGLDYVVDDAYEHIRSKYGTGGYAASAMYFPDPEYDAMLERAAEITTDRETFRTAFLEAAGYPDPEADGE